MSRGLIAALALVLAACGSGAAGRTEPRAASSSGVVIAMHRTGGIAGLDDRLVVRTSGRTEVTHRLARPPHSVTHLSAARLVSLRRAIRRADLPRRAHYPAPSGTADELHYRIATPGHRVRVDSPSHAPRRIQRLLERLDRLL